MEKIKKIRKKFKEYNLDGYLIPKNDEFFSEYVPPHKNDLQYISSFTGSYGFALILKKRNFLFVDGRYTVQAKIESGKYFKILKLPLLENNKSLQIKNKIIGFDPKLFNESFIKKFSNRLGIKCFAIKDNLVKLTKKNKYKFNKKKNFYTLDKAVTGESNLNKIKILKRYFYKNKIDVMLITSPENIAWLLNIRGCDSDYSPIPNCYLFIDKKMRIFLFCDLIKVDTKFERKLNFVHILQINKLENFLQRVKNQNFLIDELTCSIFYKNIIKKNNKILKIIDPIYYLKSQKNKVEIKNMKKVHEYDGAALTKFLFWIQSNYETKKISELTAQEKLLSIKKKI